MQTEKKWTEGLSPEQEFEMYKNGIIAENKDKLAYTLINYGGLVFRTEVKTGKKTVAELALEIIEKWRQNDQIGILYDPYKLEDLEE